MNATKPARFHYRLGANQPAESATARRLADLRQGALEFYLSGALLGGVAPTSALPLMPFVFSDSNAVFAALDGALGDRIRGELAAHGLHAFRRSWQNGFHHITTSTRPIRGADDFA